MESFCKLVLKLQNEMKDRDDALKKIPPNVKGMLTDMQGVIDKTKESFKKMQKTFDLKLDVSSFKESSELKLDKKTFF